MCTVVCNSDKTLSHVSRFQIPFSHVRIVDFCNGIFCMYNYNNNNIVYLWNPSTRKFKMLDYTRFCFSFTSGFVSLGFAYHSQNNDFKILRIVSFKRILGEQLRRTVLAEVYTLSTDSWRKVVISKIEFIAEPTHLFFNGALHSIAHTRDHDFHLNKCILSFDVNDERFCEIMLPPNYLDGIFNPFERLAVFKGSLALIVFGKRPVNFTFNSVCHIWVMKEYGVVESWTKKILPVDSGAEFFCCTDSGELLVPTADKGLNSYDPESLNKNKLDIQHPLWLGYTTSLMESLVLLDQVKYVI
jgi:F-box interacting protein